MDKTPPSRCALSRYQNNHKIGYIGVFGAPDSALQGADTNDNMEDFSLRELIDSLPASIRQMLNKCFANLDEVLKKDDAYRKSLATSA